MASLKGKVALVTGASAGIGAAITERLVKEGATVVGCARNVDKIKEMSVRLKKSGGSLHAIRCDLRKEKDILAMFEEIKKKLGGLDICINNVGIGKADTLIDGKTDAWREMLEVNVLAFCVCNREALKQFDAKKAAGHIVNIGSCASHTILPFEHFYCSTKWMTRALTDSLRMELRAKQSHTRVTSISPGMTKTEFNFKTLGPKIAEQLYKDNESLQPAQIADAVYFCLTVADNMEVNDLIVKPTSQVV